MVGLLPGREKGKRKMKPVKNTKMSDAEIEEALKGVGLPSPPARQLRQYIHEVLNGRVVDAMAKVMGDAVVTAGQIADGLVKVGYFDGKEVNARAYVSSVLVSARAEDDGENLFEAVTRGHYRYVTPGHRAEKVAGRQTKLCAAVDWLLDQDEDISDRVQLLLNASDKDRAALWEHLHSDEDDEEVA